MSVLYVTEYAASPIVQGQTIQAPKDPPLAEQTVAIGAGSVQSNAFNAKARMIRIHCDVVCSVALGSNPTATATKARMAANQTEYHAVNGGDRIAVIQNS